MIDITIPPAALEAGARRIYETWRDRDSTQLLPPWECLVAQYRQTWLDQARAACLAMLTAWPGMKHYDEMRVFGEPHSLARLILPLTQEASDE